MSSDFGGGDRSSSHRDSYRERDRSRDYSRRDWDSNRDRDRQSDRDRQPDRDRLTDRDRQPERWQSDRRQSDPRGGRYNESNRTDSYASRRSSDQGHRWKDTYRAGDSDGKMGQTLYPVQSRTQSGTFEQHDYSKSNFKEQCGITKQPKESSTPVIKELEYGLKWNDEESDENNEVQQPSNFRMQPGSTFHDDDAVNSFQDPSKRKRKRRRRGRSKTPEGELTDYERRRKEMRDQKRDEWEAVKRLPKGSGQLEPDVDRKSGSEEGGEASAFSGMSGKAKWGKRHAKRRAKTGHMPIAPVMFQKASGVLGDKVLEEKKVEKTFELMTDSEKESKIILLSQKLKQDELSYNMWSEEYLLWFKTNCTDRGFLKDKDPIEYLKTTEKEGLTHDYATVVNASKVRQFYLTFKIVSNKKERTEKELAKFKSKMEAENA